MCHVLSNGESVFVSFSSDAKEKVSVPSKEILECSPKALVYSVLIVGGYSASKGKIGPECLGCRDISQIFRGIL